MLKQISEHEFIRVLDEENIEAPKASKLPFAWRLRFAVTYVWFLGLKLREMLKRGRK